MGIFSSRAYRSQAGFASCQNPSSRFGTRRRDGAPLHLQKGIPDKMEARTGPNVLRVGQGFLTLLGRKAVHEPSGQQQELQRDP